ncbi:MAG: hypothetical protein Q8P67_18835 [archaeon]|nr:hypothetical protein [archaeon]
MVGQAEAGAKSQPPARRRQTAHRTSAAITSGIAAICHSGAAAYGRRNGGPLAPSCRRLVVALMASGSPAATGGIQPGDFCLDAAQMPGA